MKKVILLVLFFILMVAPLIADSTQQYNKILLTPYYYDSIAKNTFANFSVSISPPDRIMEVKSAIVNFQTYITSSPQDILLKVNNQSCKNPSFQGAASGFAVATFDCTNIISKAGSYNFSVTSAKDIGSTAGYLDFTYINYPNGVISFHGTEYQIPFDTSGTIWVQVLDSSGVPVDNASCMSNIIKPDKTFFVSEVSLTHLSLTNEGVYYYDFAVPQAAGVYIIVGTCYFPISNLQLKFASSQQVINGTVVGSGDYTDTFTDNGKYLEVAESGNELKYRLNFTGITLPVLSLLTEINVFFNGKISPASSAEVGIIKIFNYTGSSFVSFSNTIPPAASDNDVVNSIVNLNGLQNDFVANGTVILQFEDSNKTITGTTTHLLNDLTRVDLKFTNGTVISLKGNSELHISNATNVTSGNVLTNLSHILSYVQDINATVYMNKATLQTILALTNQTNITTLQNRGLLADINGTVYMNKATLSQILSFVTSINSTGNQILEFATDINSTVYMNKATLQTILGLTNQMNLTMLEILGYVKDINGTVYMNKNTLSQILALSLSINSTVALNSATLAQILYFAQQINTTTMQNLVILGQVNSTVNSIKTTVESNSNKLDEIEAKLDYIVVVVNETNVTVHMNKALLEELLQVSVQDNQTDNQILALLYNLTVGNVSVTANVNVSEIVQAIYGADVEDTIISAGTFAARPSLLGGVAFAADTGVSSTCIDNQTLQTSLTRLRCVNNICNTISTNTTETCQYGCNDQEVPNSCNPSPYQVNLALIVFFIIVVVLIAYALKKYT